MADRAGGEGKPAVPKEVFELDKDERWQARLDEARARREVALREKAAGKAQKPRPKPWEIDGSDVEKPPVIDPVIQERGDDKFDFADRLEALREAKADEAPASKPAVPPVARVPDSEPPVGRARDPKPPVTPVPDPEPPAAWMPEREPPAEPVPPVVRKPAAPEARARPQPSLVLPGAPDVADLAARYAATLDRPEPFTTREPTPPREAPEPRATAELVSLPTAAKPDDTSVDVAPLSRAERRRGIRPLGMAIALLGLAALPLTTEAPELQIGPSMPRVDTFRFQPALGVTWSLAERPALTNSAAWRPLPAPPRLSGAPLGAPATSVLSRVDPLPLAVPGLSGSLTWSELAPVARNVPPVSDLLAVLPETTPVITEAPAPPAPPVVDLQTPEGTAPIEPVAPRAEDAAPAVPVDAVPAPPRPTTIEGEVAPPAPPPPSARPVPSDTVVEADPLRVTILAPRRVATALTDDIASNIQKDGHELVRVRDVEFNISNRNVRYFHEEDRAAAARMAARYDAELRDFTWFRPRPVEGTAELWLAGRSPSGNTSGREQPSAPAARSELLERALERLGLGTELPDALLPGRGN